MKLERLQITAFVGAAAIMWLVVLALRGTPVSWDHAAPFGLVVSGLVLLGLLLEHVLWRQPWLHGWFIKRPDLRGTWRGQLQSNYVRPGADERIPAIECFVAVRQTLSMLQMHMMTAESESWLIAERVRTSPNAEGYQVIGVYTNEPLIHLRDQRVSEIHQGALIVETHGRAQRPTSMTAKYWTDRKTIGTMEFTANRPIVVTRFADAVSAFREQAPSVRNADAV